MTTKPRTTHTVGAVLGLVFLAVGVITAAFRYNDPSLSSSNPTLILTTFAAPTGMLIIVWVLRSDRQGH